MYSRGKVTPTQFCVQTWHGFETEPRRIRAASGPEASPADFPAQVFESQLTHSNSDHMPLTSLPTGCFGHGARGAPGANIPAQRAVLLEGFPEGFHATLGTCDPQSRPANGHSPTDVLVL